MHGYEPTRDVVEETERPCMYCAFQETRFTRTVTPLTTAAPERLKEGKVLAGGALAVLLYG